MTRPNGGRARALIENSIEQKSFAYLCLYIYFSVDIVYTVSMCRFEIEFFFRIFSPAFRFCVCFSPNGFGF